jgi:hypothetical protein
VVVDIGGFEAAGEKNIVAVDGGGMGALARWRGCSVFGARRDDSR